jgi:DNA-binding transcriptional MerR regulator
VAGLTGLVLGVSRGGISGWSDPLVIGGLVAAAILLPLFVVIERRVEAPMLDLEIFRNRLFAAATGAAFINGLSRFALLFVFVFYFQGAQGDDPIVAGLKLAPLAVGMLIASPIAGVWADRRGSRTLAALGMLVSAAGLAAMTTLEPHTAYLAAGDLALRRRRGLGHVQLAQHGGDDGHVPAQRAASRRRADDAPEHGRGALDRVRPGHRHRGGPEGRALQDLLGLAAGLSDATLAPFIHNMHTALWVLAADVAGRRRRLAPAPAPRAGGRGVSATVTGLRIGEVARRVGTTPRTIRYYEEIGLLPAGEGRESGRHRVYGEREVERLREALRLKELLGVSLDELRTLLEAEEARAALRDEWHAEPAGERRPGDPAREPRPPRPPARPRRAPPRRDRGARAGSPRPARTRQRPPARAGGRVTPAPQPARGRSPTARCSG